MLSGKPPHLESGTELRRHQVDALAGMLTALITANQRELEEANGFEALHEADDENGDLNGLAEENGQVEEVEESPRRLVTTRAQCAAIASGIQPPRGRRSPQPASSRRREPQAFLILTHRRLLVSQFIRELTAEGYGDRLTPEILNGAEPAVELDHHPDVRVVRAPRGRSQPRRLPPRHRGRGAHGAGREDLAAIRSFPGRSTSA